MLPATFEERGICLAFTTPELEYCRIRKDYKNRLEVVLPSFAAMRGNYIVPWTTLSESITLSVHDRMLQEKVEEIGAISPNDIRHAELAIACDGLAGPAVAEAAAHALEADARQVNLTNLLLMARVIIASEGASADVLIRLAQGSDHDVKIAANGAARCVGLTTAELDERLGELSILAAPLGVEGSDQPGRLRRAIGDLQFFEQSIGAWSPLDDSVTDLAKFCGEVVGMTLRTTSVLIREFDDAVGAPIDVLRRWDDERDRLHGLISRLSWLLDGWEKVVRLWTEALPREKQVQEQALYTIFRILPLLPQTEFAEDEAARLTGVREKHQHTVQLYENWRTGEPDYELIARIEEANARAIKANGHGQL